MEKNISVACVYQRDTSKNVFPGCRLQTLYSKSKEKMFNTTTDMTRCGDDHEETQLSAHYS